MAASVTYDGYQELRAFLEQLPEATKAAVRTQVQETVDQVQTELVAVYPSAATTGPTGQVQYGAAMRALVTSRVDTTPGAIGAKGVVVSRSPAAHLWEFGTAVRTTQQGWNRGSEPAHPDKGLVTIAIKHRAVLYRDLFAMLEQLGFTVTGTP